MSFKLILVLGQNYYHGLCGSSSKDFFQEKLLGTHKIRCFITMHAYPLSASLRKSLHLLLQAKASGRTPEEYEKKGDFTGVSCSPECSLFFMIHSNDLTNFVCYVYSD